MTGEVINFDGGEVVGNAGEFNFLNSISPEKLENMLQIGKNINMDKNPSYGAFVRMNPHDSII